mmetsp:Transcript_34125/g.44047  ORF Transcript_34125/g.44047 Transcript_34125/m.44047 type:complete len:172 (-) Transcript_34125:154-669(-)
MLKNDMKIENELEISKVLKLAQDDYEKCCEQKLHEQEVTLKNEFEEKIKKMVEFEKQRQERMIEEEKQKATETITQISTISASKLTNYEQELEDAVAKRTEILEERIKFMEDSNTRKHLKSESENQNQKNSILNSSIPIQKPIFSIPFIMIFIAFMCTWFGSIITINFFPC